MKHTTRFILFMIILCSISLTACSSSSSNQDSQAPVSDNEAPIEKMQEAERLLPGVDLPEIELLTPAESAGLKPKFEWKAVEGAASYSLVLFDTDGRTYWAWMGKTTYIYMGSSLTPPPEDSAGPILQPDMRWAVAAYDSEHHLLATSAYRSIAP